MGAHRASTSTWLFSNCLIFALWRWITRGGYLVIRRSHYGWWPHIIWCEHLHDAEIEHYVPLEYSTHFAASHKVLFHGYVSKVDQGGPDQSEDQNQRDLFQQGGDQADIRPR